MKSLLLTILIFSLLLNVGNAQTKAPKAEINFTEIGNIKSRKASEIKASYLGIGCEVLDRDYANYHNYKEYLGNLGVKHARFQSGWAKTEKQKGVYDFSWLDSVFDDCRSRGIQPWMNTSYGNPILEGGGDKPSSSKLPDSVEALQAWDNFIRSLVTHFKDRVFEWEIWNEVDHGRYKAASPDQYMEFYVCYDQLFTQLIRFRNNEEIIL